MRKSILSAIAAILCFASAAFSQNAHAVRVAGLMEQLRQVPVADDPTEVPPDARPLLALSKEELGDFISDLLNGGQEFASLDEFRAAAIASLQNAGVKFHFTQPGTTIESDDPEYDKYGYVTELKISQPDAHPDLRVVVAALQVPCGSDSALSIFQQEGSGWKRILSDEAAEYDKISGALGSFDYAISPPAADGSWFVLTANVNPWCSSDWQTIRYNVLRPGSDPGRPTAVFSNSNAVFLGEDEVFKLHAWADQFEVVYFGDEPLDTDKLIRVHTDQFNVLGNDVHRIAPVALAPQEFVDEWTQLPWGEAAEWLDTDRPDNLQEWHQRLARSDAHSYTSEFQFAQPCKGNGPDRWQVGLSLYADRTAKDLPDKIFFTVIRQNGAFLMQEISDRRAPGCPGDAAPTDSWTGYSLP